MTKQTGENIIEGQTLVKCPTCKKELATWGKNYFTHCGKRHDVAENLAADLKEDETSLAADELEDDETLVRCSKCGDFLITTETENFTHCGVEQLVKDNLGEFEDLNGGEDGEEEEEDEEGSEKSKATLASTRAILSDGKGSRKKTKDKKDRKANKAGEEEEKPDEGEEESADTDTPDKEPETWSCIECGTPYTDNGYSDATCPECGCEYAEPYEEE